MIMLTYTCPKMCCTPKKQIKHPKWQSSEDIQRDDVSWLILQGFHTGWCEIAKLVHSSLGVFYLLWMFIIDIVGEHNSNNYMLYDT